MVPVLLIASGAALVAYGFYKSRPVAAPEVLPGPPLQPQQTALFAVGDRVVFTSWDSGKQMPATITAVFGSPAGFAKYAIKLDENGRALTDIAQTDLHKAA